MNVFLLSFLPPICIIKKINTILILLAMIWFSSCKHFNFFSLFPFMDISWWSMSVWITFFSFIVLGPWCIPSIKKIQILLLWNVYLYYYCWYFDTLLLFLRFFLKFLFLEFFLSTRLIAKILNFSLFFRASFSLCSTSKNIFSNFIFKPSFIFFLSYFKFLRISLILNCSSHQDVSLYCCLVKKVPFYYSFPMRLHVCLCF